MKKIPKLKDGEYDLDEICKNQSDLLDWANEAEIDLEALESDYKKQTETLNGICQHNLKLMQELQYYKDRDGFCEDCYAEHISNIKVGTDEEAK